MGFKSILCIERRKYLICVMYLFSFQPAPLLWMREKWGKGEGERLERINSHFNNLMYTKALV